ncbi:hypothetical protein [uncultured Arcobacter sp.]|uniref:hypothetical protein n=1 Tax=uncultured Arcobacter sp. TaxID=165434 RepID=UPI00262DEB27|nr:hypothetical protein [uncultured Arcobacter sp.]
MDEEKMTQAHAESKRKSKEELEKGIKTLEEAYQLMVDELEATKVLQNVQRKYPRPLKAEYQFQEVEDFWKAVDTLTEIKNKRQIMAMESQIRQSEKSLNASKEQLKEMGE